MQKEAAMHVREYGGLLAIPEKKTLHWLVQRMPPWINSDHLTLLGLGSMLLAGASYWMAQWNKFTLIVVVIALAANWFGDSLDGTLARFRNDQRPRYGYYVDHVIDLVGTAALLGGLSLSGYMNPLIGIGLLAAFALVEAEVFLATHVHEIFRLATFRIGPTELRIILAVGTLYLLYDPWISIAGRGPYLLFDAGGIIAIAGLLAAFVCSGVRNTRLLYRSEPLSKPNQSEKKSLIPKPEKSA